MSDRSTDALGQPAPDETHLTQNLNRPQAPSTYEGDETQAPTEISPTATRSEVVPTVPGYEILKELGRGGMGVVYQAKHQSLNRVVALKMILAGAHAGPEALARFRTEAEAVARLTHPNIVQIYDVGEHNGLPYFSLEYCHGGSLEDKLNGVPLLPNEAARLVEELARAMQVAHDANVIHRDLKPANVLLASEGSPKITDFGLAKKLDEAGQTQSGAVMGTPSYMAPEQARAERAQIGPATDVYALGAILYECLTGRPPFRAATAMDTVLQVISAEPVAPQQLQRGTPVDLETICLKCLQKDPHKRYPSPTALAEDLRRFQANEPIAARPVSRSEKAWRWAKRNPTVASLTSLLALVMVVGLALVLWQWREAEAAHRVAATRADSEAQAKEASLQAKKVADDQRKRAEEALDQAEKALRRSEVALYFVSVSRAAQAARAGNAAVAQRALDRCRLDLRQWEWHLLRRGQHLEGLPLEKLEGGVNDVAFSGDGLRLAVAGRDNKVRLYDAASGKFLNVIGDHAGPVRAIAFSRDGKQFATAESDHSIKLWEVAGSKEPFTLKRHAAPVITLAFSPDGKSLASGSTDTTAIHWNLEKRKLVRELGGHGDAIIDVCFSPDGKSLATASADGTAKVWRIDSLRPLTLRGHSRGVVSIRLDGGGRALTASLDGTLKIWDLKTGKAARTIRGSAGRADWIDKGTRIVALAQDHLKVWDVATGEEVLSVRGPDGFLPRRIAVGPRGLRVAAAGLEKQGSVVSVRLWQATPLPERMTMHATAGSVSAAALSYDGKLLLTAGMGLGLDSGRWQLWSMETGLELHVGDGHAASIMTACFRPDGKQFVTGSIDCSLMTWSTETGESVQTFIGHSKPVVNVKYSPDGTRLLSLAADGAVRVWNAQTGKALHVLEGHDVSSRALAVSRDGKRVAALSKNGELLVWDADSGAREALLAGAVLNADVAFSPDGKRVAAGGPVRRVSVWDVSSRKKVQDLQASCNSVARVRFEAGGKRLSAAAAGGATIETWSIDGNLSGTETYEVVRNDVKTSSLSALDSRYVITVHPGNQVKVWARPRK